MVLWEEREKESYSNQECLGVLLSMATMNSRVITGNPGPASVAVIGSLADYHDLRDSRESPI